MSAKKKAKKASAAPLVFTSSYTPAPDSAQSFTLKFTSEPAHGVIRIRYGGKVWRIEKYGDYTVCYGLWGEFAFDRTGWHDIATARTLWGIERQWRKLYGTSKPFPSFPPITAWTSEVVT